MNARRSTTASSPVGAAWPPPLLASVRWIGSGLAPADRQVIAQQLLVGLRDYYVHLPLKISSLAINPVQQAVLLADDAAVLEERAFFERVTRLVNSLRDRHTAFRLPQPWASMQAYLPFLVERYWDGKLPRYVVTKIHEAGVEDPHFRPGVEITHWNGVPIIQYVKARAALNNGANREAQFALAAFSLTLRSLAYELPPAEDWASITYVADGTYRTTALPWHVYAPPPAAPTGPLQARVLSGAAAPPDIVRGVDDQLLSTRKTAKLLFANTALRAAGAQLGAAGKQSDSDNPLAANLEFREVQTDRGSFGYIRIFSFETDDADGFVQAFAGILGRLPQTGLIIDVRGNPGGNITSGEALMQLFTDKPVLPEPVAFRSTPQTRAVAQTAGFFAPWLRSLTLANQTGQEFSQGFCLTSEEQANGIGRVYRGPVVVVVDAMIYSTSCFFTAGMQDNGIARIVGTEFRTGAGGANVWAQSLLAQFVAAAGGHDVVAMPGGADMNIAMRRSLRVGDNAGIPVEGLGVSPDYVHPLTRRDLLEKNVDLMNFCAFVLSSG